MRAAGRGSRNVDRVQKCGSRVQKCGSVGRKCELSKMRVAVAGREMRVTSREIRVRLPNVEGLGNSMAYLCTFVTPLSQVILTLYLTWCLFRIIDISHIPHCYGN